MAEKFFLKLDDLCDLEIESYGLGHNGLGNPSAVRNDATAPMPKEVSVSFGDAGGHYALLFKAYLQGDSFKQAVIKNIEILGWMGWWRQKSGIVFDNCMISALTFSAAPRGNYYTMTLNFDLMTAI